MKSNIYTKIFFIVTMIWLGSMTILAQPGDVPGGAGNGGPVGGGDAGIPLDGGIISLLLAGLGILAVRKLKRKKA